MKVSIYVCVYNQEDLLQRALDSIPKRTDIEVVIINDGSTDGTIDICKKYAKENPNCVLINLTENVGLGRAKNFAYDTASGDYLYELDSDDYLITDQFERAMNELDGTDMVFVNLLTNNGTVFRLDEEHKHGYCAGMTKFIKRSFLGDTRCQQLKWGEDWFLNEELLKKPHTEKFTNITCYRYNFPRKGSLYDQMVNGK